MDNIIRIWWNEDALLISPKDKKILLLEVCGYHCEVGQMGGRRRRGAHLEHYSVLLLRLLNHAHVAPHDTFEQGAELCGPSSWKPGLFVCGSRRAPPSHAGVVVYETSPPHTSSSMAGRNCVCAHRSNIKILNKFLCLSQIAWRQCLFELIQQKWTKCRRRAVDLCFK